jgi:probable HAF family extracellular repeat protein
MRSKGGHVRSIIGLLMIGGIAMPATAQVFFEGTGVAAGRMGFVPRRLSADGRFLVGWDGRAMRWSRELGFEFLGSVSPAGTGTAEGVSADGQWVVGYSWVSGNPPVAFRWSSSTGIVHLPFPAAIDVSNGGPNHYVVGDALINAVPQAVRWSTVGGLAPLGVPVGAERTLSQAASADAGVVVGWIDYGGHERAFRWSAAGGMEDLGTLPGQADSIARGVSADGKVVLGAASGRAFRWTRAHGMHDIGPSIAGAYDVSDDGWRVIGQHSAAPEAFLWDPVNGLRFVKDELLAMGLAQVADWDLISGIGISADGTIIAGEGLGPDKRFQGWVARIPPFCYANCDGSTTPPALNVADFTCFLQKFVAGDIYANCNNDGSMDVSDFTCFLQKFAQGCP